jgi:metal-dependent amidase/aminoacylase/carboxypeptidase family protein
MTWSTLPAYSDGNALTAAQMTAIKDNINETAPAKATTAGYWFVSTGTNAVAERAILSTRNNNQQTRTSTSYGNLSTVGPVVTITTGTQALVHIANQMFNSGAFSCWSSYAITGATTRASDDEHGLSMEGGSTQAFKMGVSSLEAVTGGSNVFTQQYRVGSGGGTGSFDDREVIVMAL